PRLTSVLLVLRPNIWTRSGASRGAARSASPGRQCGRALSSLRDDRLGFHPPNRRADLRLPVHEPPARNHPRRGHLLLSTCPTRRTLHKRMRDPRRNVDDVEGVTVQARVGPYGHRRSLVQRVAAILPLATAAVVPHA